MDSVRIDERDVDWARVSERVETGVTVHIMRGRQVFATIAPGECPLKKRPELHPSWKAAGIDWEEIRRFAETLPYDPSNSVEEMRKEARY